MQRKENFEETVQHDEADCESGNLTGYHGKETSCLAQDTVHPGPSLPQEFPSIIHIRSSNHSQIDAHEQIGETQAIDKHLKTRPSGRISGQHPIDNHSAVPN